MPNIIWKGDVNGLMHLTHHSILSYFPFIGFTFICQFFTISNSGTINTPMFHFWASTSSVPAQRWGYWNWDTHRDLFRLLLAHLCPPSNFQEVPFWSGQEANSLRCLYLLLCGICDQLFSCSEYILFLQKQSPLDYLKIPFRQLYVFSVLLRYPNFVILKSLKFWTAIKKTSYCGLWDPWRMSPQPIQLGKLLKTASILSMTLTFINHEGNNSKPAQGSLLGLMSQQGVLEFCPKVVIVFLSKFGKQLSPKGRQRMGKWQWNGKQGVHMSIMSF